MSWCVFAYIIYIYIFIYISMYISGALDRQSLQLTALSPHHEAFRNILHTLIFSN